MDRIDRAHERLGKVESELDARACRLPQDRREPGDELCQLGGARAQLLASGERQQAIDNLEGALERAVGLLHERHGVALGGQRRLEKREGGARDLDGVAEIVGDAAGDAPIVSSRWLCARRACSSCVPRRCLCEDEGEPGGQQPDDEGATAHDGGVIAPCVVDRVLGLSSGHQNGAVGHGPKAEYSRLFPSIGLVLQATPPRFAKRRHPRGDVCVGLANGPLMVGRAREKRAVLEEQGDKTAALRARGLCRST